MASPHAGDPQNTSTESVNRPWLPATPDQPTLLLDFDGVINAICRFGQESRGFTRHTIWLDQETWPEHEWIMPVTPGGQAFSIVLSQRHTAFIRELLDAGVHVVWATTWQHAVLEPMRGVGFPELPVLPISDLNIGQPKTHTTMDWKAQAMQAAYSPTTPILFVDDSATPLLSMQPGPHGGPFTVVVPRERYGLTSRDMTQIRVWARNATTENSGARHRA